MKIDQIIRSARKTIAIIVNRDGTVVVRAPYRASQAQIMDFVQRKTGWIAEKQEQARLRPSLPAAHSYGPGELFLYLGNSYPLLVRPLNGLAIKLAGGSFVISPEVQARAQDVFMAWYRRQALLIIGERAQIHAARFNLSYSKLRITSARTRWGSCSSLGTLSFTWRLVMAPLSAIDYVVIHELAHLVERNHSAKFWARVAQMMPAYKQQVAWLKENGRRLTLD